MADDYLSWASDGRPPQQYRCKGPGKLGICAALILQAVGLTIADSGCSSSGMGRAYIYHTFEVIVDKDAGTVANIRYTYGAALVDRTQASARPGIPLELFSTRMIIPDTFNVEWETPDGEKHEAAVPVRLQLHESIEYKTVYFVIHQDHVEGFIGHYDRIGLHIESRFY